MKDKDLFIKAIGTLFFSWGSEAPSEVFWGANDLLEWFEKEHNVQLGIRFDEENPDNYNDVIDAIRNS
jgi:hypothetical protein